MVMRMSARVLRVSRTSPRSLPAKRDLCMRNNGPDSNHIKLFVPEKLDIADNRGDSLSRHTDHEATAYLISQFPQMLKALQPAGEGTVSMQSTLRICISTFDAKQIAIGSSLFPESVILMGAFTQGKGDCYGIVLFYLGYCPGNCLCRLFILSRLKHHRMVSLLYRRFHTVHQLVFCQRISR